MQASLCSICRSSSISFSTSRIAAKFSFSTLPTNRYAHHEEVRQSLRKVLGKDSKFSHSALKARGSLFTLKGPANESIPDIDVQKADKLDKLETCRAYNLQPRDLGTLDVDVVRARVYRDAIFDAEYLPRCSLEHEEASCLYGLAPSSIRSPR